jgi:hypothetical protein
LRAGEVHKGQHWCVVVFTLHPSFSHLILIMPRPAGGAKKRPVAKALALKEAVAKKAMVKPSAWKAASGISGMHVTQGKENRPVTAAPAPISSTSATSVRRTCTGAQPAPPSLSRGMSATISLPPFVANSFGSIYTSCC